MEQIKRKRGRPRKNTNNIPEKKKNEEKKTDENIVLFLALSSEEEDNNSEEDNRFTINDTETKKNDVESLSESESDSDSEELSDKLSNTCEFDTKMLIEEIKKRDLIINNLKSRGNSILNSSNSTKPYTINYHCVQIADSKTGKEFVPHRTHIKCWWDDEEFDNLPAYIVNYYKNGKYYVFGNFCSFNCAAKYNVKMLKDYKCSTRYALINNLKSKITGDDSPIKLAPERELLKSKGGLYTIDKFREGFSVISSNLRMNIPPIIPLVHVIEEGNKD
jgi:hypothetical protein